MCQVLMSIEGVGLETEILRNKNNTDNQEKIKGFLLLSYMK